VLGVCAQQSGQRTRLKAARGAQLQPRVRNDGASVGLVPVTLRQLTESSLRARGCRLRLDMRPLLSSFSLMVTTIL